ncbi:NADH-quinone oxidoreductase subunit NuoK [Ornithinimicrobium ciconiae]|uniref:NADH-quinone oxidoreductase subunit K n=1 Tax=Ornithinimicrobium ciconiae TaxID=2594265 RepID=A0A516G888_9MICO|nr:NADH-quinone oxidoreductase subunit NuoK [Ornithinimicrobium ciconiae]QDO87744.1 NADH-quinone oxidoreductase subunit NuoK [Ornithinimicrobium ciconiae]
MSAALPFLLAAVLAGAGTYGVLARRHAVLMLIGVELLLAAAGLILVTVGQLNPDPLASGAVLTLFIITIAAAEIVVALAVIMAMFRTRGDVDLTGESIPAVPTSTGEAIPTVPTSTRSGGST